MTKIQITKTEMTKYKEIWTGQWLEAWLQVSLNYPQTNIKKQGNIHLIMWREHESHSPHDSGASKIRWPSPWTCVPWFNLTCLELLGMQVIQNKNSCIVIIVTELKLTAHINTKRFECDHIKSMSLSQEYI